MALMWHCGLDVGLIDWLELLRLQLKPQLLCLLETAAHESEQRGWQLYLVGGVVRDLLLADSRSRPATPPERDPLGLGDLDLVVDGCRESPSAGVVLAQALQQLYPTASLTIHDQFQTAELYWHQDAEFQSLSLDIATARTEVYPYPAANPVVSASTIRLDLYRRDFTINAMAIPLTPPRSGELLDCFGGLPDLHRRYLRVLHDQSFIDDPTRMYRAVRFAVRLGFEIEPQTRAQIKMAIASGIYPRTQAEHPSTPALQTRLRAELEYTLAADYWKRALRLLGELEALRCVHPRLELTRELLWRVRLGDRLGRGLAIATSKLPLWLLRLELLLSGLEGEERDRVATQLQLPPDSLQRLANLDQHKTLALATLTSGQRPSQIYQALQTQSIPTLILISAQVNRRIRRHLWQYLTRWRGTKPPLNGTDLQAMGYSPGREFQAMLSAVLVAYLDGELGSPEAPRSELKQAARRLIESRFPRPLPPQYFGRR